MPGRFLDTNVLLYLASSDSRKVSLAKRLLDEECFISVQVLNEIVNVLCKKNRMPWAEIRSFLELIKGLTEVVPINVDTHLIGVNLAERYGFTIYDSMIIAAAIQSGCDAVLSEDMQHGQLIDGLTRIVNPFA
jgi:predicted nucleic acid-binding protein